MTKKVVRQRTRDEIDNVLEPLNDFVEDTIDRVHRLRQFIEQVDVPEQIGSNELGTFETNSQIRRSE